MSRRSARWQLLVTAVVLCGVVLLATPVGGVLVGATGTATEAPNAGTTRAVQDGDHTVRSITLGATSIEAGSAVTVEAIVANDGSESTPIEIGLEVNGEVTETAVVPEIFPGPDVNARHSFEFVPDQPGNYSISVGGIEREEQLSVSPAEESSGGGGLFSFLGFLPLGILQPIVLFLVLPILLIYLALKALAIYLGY